jgi:hypothetical protein
MSVLYPYPSKKGMGSKSILFFLKFKTDRIDAVTLPSLFCWPIIKNVTEMRTARLAENLGPFQAETVVFF